MSPAVASPKSIVTNNFLFLTTFQKPQQYHPPTLTMPTETFKTNHGNVPKLTELNYPISRDKVRRVLMGVDAYAIVCSRQFTEYVSPWSNRSTRGITGLRILTGQLAEPTHTMS
jgi:hypothetical protein